MGVAGKPVQLVPPGLLGMLQLKSMGMNPSILDDTYSPSIELGEWLMTQNREYIVASLAVSAAQAGPGIFNMTSPATIQVPDGEWWYVWNHSAVLTLTVATDSLAIWFGPTITAANTAGQIVNAIPFDVTGVAAPGITAAAAFEPRRWYAPQTQFGAGAGRLVTPSGTAVIVTILEITRLPN